MPEPTSHNDSKSAAVVEAFMTLYNEGRIPEAMAQYVHPDCRYTLHVDATAAPVGGETCGRDNILAVLLRYHQIFEFILFHTRTLSAADGVVRQSLEYILRHRLSNERLTGTGRFVWTVRDGLIVACEECQDARKLETFFRLFGNGGPDQDRP
jgi:ketosteroid isomerase-like protein